ncbi:Inner membrane protein YjdF [Vibrio thalassae]|uniref:Inner membrane protein YjdF n=2 Tax=Vibrio thalassae TaxID=1243014 RepID=A0A240ENS7_9VIBR|nr:Inner membrane protein YjdF [Vibrio thalassae]
MIMNDCKSKRYCPVLIGLTGFYCLVFVFSAIAPSSRAVWVAEIIPALAILLIIWLVSSKFQFSRTAYVLMFMWLILHTIGAKYTFANVPFDWFNQLIGSQRNNFDRVAHFSIGLYAFSIAEYVYRNYMMDKRSAMMFALFAIMSLAAAYEIIEWWYAAVAGGDEGIAFLGSQGDIWDAQKDMLCDTVGALTALTLFVLNTPSRE